MAIKELTRLKCKWTRKGKGVDKTLSSVFEIVPSPSNFFYPYEGLRTMNEAVEFCATKGGPGTVFGYDDDAAKTDGRWNK